MLIPLGYETRPSPLLLFCTDCCLGYIPLSWWLNTLSWQLPQAGPEPFSMPSAIVPVLSTYFSITDCPQIQHFKIRNLYYLTHSFFGFGVQKCTKSMNLIQGLSQSYSQGVSWKCTHLEVWLVWRVCFRTHSCGCWPVALVPHPVGLHINATHHTVACFPQGSDLKKRQCFS